MRIMTYNIWHGLDGRGRLFFGQLEPTRRRLMRAKAQVHSLQIWKPEILFLQEVNPLYPATYYFSSELNLPHHIEQMDLSGIKFFGVGPPFNLQSGLATMTTAEIPLQFLQGIKLSGEGPSNRGPFSFQLHECRYALVGELKHSSWGRVLVINLHLHHGLEYDTAWNELIQKMVQAGELTENLAQQVQNDLLRGDDRRLQEIEKLIEFLSLKKDEYDLVLMGGDFNSGPKSVIAKKIQSLGFLDAWSRFHPKLPGLTWDRTKNKDNHRFNEKFLSLFHFSVKGLSDRVAQTLLERVREAEERPRRIDFIYYYTPHAHRLYAELIVAHDSKNNIIGSDHFAVGVELRRA